MFSGLQAPFVFILQASQANPRALHLWAVPVMAQLHTPSQGWQWAQSTPIPLHMWGTEPQQTARADVLALLKAQLNWVFVVPLFVSNCWKEPAELCWRNVSWAPKIPSKTCEMMFWNPATLVDSWLSTYTVLTLTVPIPYPISSIQLHFFEINYTHVSSGGRFTEPHLQSNGCFWKTSVNILANSEETK